jgi:nucleoside-diphosphate-sugar epimerase
VRELRAHGVAGVAHVRPDSPKLGEWEARFQAHYAVVDTTPWELHALRESLERWQPTHIFALLGTTRARVRQARTRGQNDSYETVDYGLTSMLLRAQLLTGRTARFVYLSSIGVNANTRNPYLAVRWRMETELRESGLPYVIARPGFITGPDRAERRLSERALAVASDALLAVGGMLGARKLRARFQSMTGAQLATALVHAAVDERYTNVILDSAQLRELADH